MNWIQAYINAIKPIFLETSGRTSLRNLKRSWKKASRRTPARRRRS